MIRSERGLWDEKPKKKESAPINSEHHQEHVDFSTNNGPEILRMFLFKAN